MKYEIQFYFIMEEPKRLDITPKELAKLLDRLEKGELTEADRVQLRDVLLAMVWMGQKLEDKELSIRRMQRLFGMSTEKAEKLFGDKKPDDDDGSNSAGGNGGTGNPPATPDNGNQTKPSKVGGQHGSDQYPDAEKIIYPHESLKVGAQCGECLRGTLYLYGYGRVLRLLGQAAIKAIVHQPEQLRCSACQIVFTAVLPASVGSERADPTAKSVVAMFRYGSGIPFYRNEKLQEGFRTPLPDSTQWHMSEEVGNCGYPVYKACVRESAKREHFNIDDTGVLILDLKKELKRKNGERQGLFTTGIVAKGEGPEITLVFSGNRHAGENIQTVLKHRDENLPLAKVMCDAASRNDPKDVDVILANCLDHARRMFVDLCPKESMKSAPQECLYFITRLGVVYHHDQQTKNMNAEDRLKYHKTNSLPIMKELKSWCEANLVEKLVEPNSGLGGAMKYFINHYPALTKFTEVTGMALSNAAVERFLKTVVLHRKNSLFYKTENGALVGDIIMSLIQTAKRCGANVFDYLTQLQINKSDVAKNPDAWFPWNYLDRLNTLQLAR